MIKRVYISVTPSGASHLLLWWVSRPSEGWHFLYEQNRPTWLSKNILIIYLNVLIKRFNIVFFCVLTIAVIHVSKALWFEMTVNGTRCSHLNNRIQILNQLRQLCAFQVRFPVCADISWLLLQNWEVLPSQLWKLQVPERSVKSRPSLLLALRTSNFYLWVFRLSALINGWIDADFFPLITPHGENSDWRLLTAMQSMNKLVPNFYLNCVHDKAN